MLGGEKDFGEILGVRKAENEMGEKQNGYLRQRDDLLRKDQPT